MNVSKGARLILALAQLFLIVGLAIQFFDGGISGNWIFVLSGVVLLNLAFSWDSIITDLKS